LKINSEYYLKCENHHLLLFFFVVFFWYFFNWQQGNGGIGNTFEVVSVPTPSVYSLCMSIGGTILHKPVSQNDCSSMCDAASESQYDYNSFSSRQYELFWSSPSAQCVLSFFFLAFSSLSLQKKGVFNISDQKPNMIRVEEEEQVEFETLLVHCDEDMEPGPISDVAPPIHMATTFEMMDQAKENFVYSRAHHPTRRRLEKLLGMIEGGYATVYSSGLACVAALIQHIKPCKIFIAKKEGYFGCQDVMNFFVHIIECYHGSDESLLELVDIEHLDQFIEQHVNQQYENDTGATVSSNALAFKNGRQSPYLIWLETPKNPSCILEDIESYSKKAKQIGALLVVDSTFATPIIQKPLKLGADFVMHSATKFLAGHSDVLAGVVVSKNEITAKMLHKEQSVMGNVLGNMESWLLLRSLRTVKLRVMQQSETAQKLAEWLESQVKNPETNSVLTKVWYPNLKSSPYYDLCQKQMNGRGPGMISIELDSPENAQKLPSLLHVFIAAVSLGGYESLIDYRYKWDKTVSPLLLRLSIGLENVQDLIKDLKRAFQQLGKAQS
jgi:cystathionine gamma-synthase